MSKASAKWSRLDTLLVERGLVELLEQARRMIIAGEVRVGGETAAKPAMCVASDVQIKIVARPRFVSRGGEKLAAALERFPIDIKEQICADVGASTGGFTDVLLQAGARRVYAIDAGYGQLAWALRQDERVTVMERTNARYLESLPEPIGLATIDVSFISLGLILPAVRGWLAPGAEIVALVKPQFEAERSQVEQGGVVGDPAVHREVLERAAGFATENRLILAGMMPSPLRGPAGNIEFLMWLKESTAERSVDPAALIDEVVSEAHASDEPDAQNAT